MSASRNAIRAALHQLIGDKYEVLQWIGGGGMSEVYLAKHRTHGALFAVKVLSESLAGEPKIVARFMEEARTAASLSGHPNIAGIFDVGEAAGIYYLIMPYVEGEDVSRYLERHGRLNGQESLHIIRQVTEALVWAGARNVVHRDLKPSNIRIDRSGRVLVLDFGIAKAGDIPSPLTSAGETMGTPYYMSPEQIRGELCDSRSDLYSLGIIFFELLSGQKPFTADTLRAIEEAHLRKLPPALSTLVADVDPALEQIVNKLLEKNAADRYPSAEALLRDLKKASDGRTTIHLTPEVDRPRQEGSNANPAGGAAAEPRWQRQEELPPTIPKPKPKSNVAILAIAAVVVAGGIGAGWYFWPKPDKTIVDGGGKGKPPLTLPATQSDGHGTMFLVAAGPFIFGDNAPESPNKRETRELAAFYVDATEVSNEQYQEFVKATGHPALEPAAANLPAAGVGYDEALAYCIWAGKRLPSEMEWEKAARGDQGRIYPWGNEPLPSPGRLVPVDAYPERQSPSRALNMSGNVFEWTTTGFPATDRELEDLRRLTGGEVSREWYSIKGGSFLQKEDLFLRLYMRRGWPVRQTSPLIGFRCVKDAE